MKASIAHGIRPSVLILGKDSKKGWGRWDIVLAKAYQRFLNELCQQCGGPKYLCHNDDNRIQYTVGRDECASAAKAEKAQEEVAKQKTKSYGVRLYGKPSLVQAEGMEFSDFRLPFLLEEAKKQGLIPND